MPKRKKATRKRKEERRIHAKNVNLTCTVGRSEYTHKLQADIAFVQKEVAELLKARRGPKAFIFKGPNLSSAAARLSHRRWREWIEDLIVLPADVQVEDLGANRLKELNARIRNLERELAKVTDPEVVRVKGVALSELESL